MVVPAAFAEPAWRFAGLEFAMRERQLARGERGLGLTTAYGGVW